jgi:hypothetical protein
MKQGTEMQKCILLVEGVPLCMWALLGPGYPPGHDNIEDLGYANRGDLEYGKRGGGRSTFDFTGRLMSQSPVHAKSPFVDCK